MLLSEVCPVFFSKMGELGANHEAMKQELENSHTEQLQCVKQQYEMSLEGAYSTQLQTFSEAAF